MSDITLRVEGLGKKYRIGERQEAYKTMRDGVASAAENSIRKLGHLFGRNGSVPDLVPTDYWALRDVSFDVKHGEVVGVIGKNGAGKSTLLKILSRITEPTEGRARVYGRIGSLLEVGTGFHPELTGRENIYMNGAILGMTKADIDRKFEEIVAFGGIEAFLDTPVKRYSSGMQLRLGFAVAAHLEPDILIVDEVLAVGDEQFQSRCLARMNEVSRAGRTVLLVSHSMQTIQRLCTRVLVMADGNIELDSEPLSAIGTYLNKGAAGVYLAAPSSAKPTITKASAQVRGSSIVLSVNFESPFPLMPPVLGFVIYDSAGTPVFGTNARTERSYSPPSSMQRGTVEVRISADYFRSNRYFISLWLGDRHSDFCVVEKALQLDIHNHHSGSLPHQTNGSAYLPTQWTYADSAKSDVA